MISARTYLALGAWLLTMATNAQNGLTMSTKGTSSLLFRGNTLGVNVTDANIEFGVNNLDQTIARERMAFFGLGARAGNASGVGNIFSTGNFVPGATAEGYVGITCSNRTAPTLELDRFQKQVATSSAEYYATMQHAAEEIITDTNLMNFRDSVLSVIRSAKKVRKAIDPIDQLIKEPHKEGKQACYDSLRSLHDGMIERIDEEVAAMGIEVGRRNVIYEGSGCYRQVWFFGFGGIDGNNFKLVGSYDTVNVANSFTKQEYRGGYAGLGVNVQLGILTFGLTYQYRQTNNLTDLIKVDYTIRTTTTTGSTSLIQEQKGTAYAGTYGLVEVNQLNVDLAVSLRLDPEALSHVLLSPYARFNRCSRDITLLKNTWNFGIGSYFIEKTGKFIGGLYVELPDVGNAVEKARPVAEQNLKPAEQRITFGIVAKVTLGSILNIF